ncbi:hypothetical protein, unknown function [Leishmania tarentolae]|uniref:Uncharacterized protein n=1 Tax=Leishmania tarentolae TaxID=5689 RepID=A0A640KRV0_LEITA|nr:hypothetical protein, unknown function [Leishmania tarentolae]
MTAMVASIGIPLQERVQLCAVAAAHVCQQAVAHIKAASQGKAHDAAVAPYIRAVYVYRDDSIAPERVTVASGSECGSYLRETLQVTVVGVGAPCVACWLTVTLEDTCILQHAVFAISPSSKEPLKMMSPVLVQPDGAAPSAGGNVYTPCHEQASINVITRALAVGAGLPLSGTRGHSFGTVPYSHSAHASEKVVETAVQQPQLHGQLAPPPDQQPACNRYEQIEKYETGTARDLATRSRHSSRAVLPLDEDATASAPLIGGSGCKASPSPRPYPFVYSRPQSAVDHSNGHYSASNTRNAVTVARPDPQQELSRAREKPRSHPPPSSVSAERPAWQRNADDLKRSCPRTDLVVPTNRKQWGDGAFRTYYSPRREELWEMADAVMTHNYYDPIIENGDSPPCHRSVSSRRSQV